MAKVDSSKYILQNSLFAPWQILIFTVAFAIIGGLMVINTFAAQDPIKSFAIAKQAPGFVEFSASTSEKSANNTLVVTNNCYNSDSVLVKTQSAILSGWITDPAVGRIGYASFNVTSKLRCFAYVHPADNNKSLATFSYVSL